MRVTRAVAYVVVKTLTSGRRAYLVRYKAPDGRRRSKQFARRKDADYFASTVEVEVAHGLCVDPAGGKETLSAWVARWWPTTVNLRETSRARDASVLRIHVLPAFGSVPLPRIEREEMRFLDTREISRLADANDPRYRHFVVLAAYSGLRVGEVAGLTWERVDLLRRRVDVDGPRPVWAPVPRPSRRCDRRARSHGRFLSVSPGRTLPVWAIPHTMSV